MSAPTTFTTTDGSVLTGSLIRFVVSTLPILAVFCYFIYKTYERTHRQYSFYYDENGNKMYDIDEPLLSLMDINIVFLTFMCLWTLFLVYLTFYIPRRRHFLGRYLSEGESTLGDIIYVDTRSNLCCPQSRILHYSDYGYAVYAHPVEGKVIRKRVRVYQQYTRERVSILKLPDRPFSGQPRMEIEMDLTTMKRERDTIIKYMILISIIWALFCLGGAIYAVYSMTVLEIEHGVELSNESATRGRRLLFAIVALNIPFAVTVNGIQFLLWRNWMVNRGAILDNDIEARKVTPNCLTEAPSVDGSDVIPYSIMGDQSSFNGTLYSHSNTIANGGPPTGRFNRNVSKKPSTIHVGNTTGTSAERESSLISNQKNWTTV